MKKNINFFITGLFMLSVLFFISTDAWCGQLNYRLKWLFNASVVGDLYADARGFFKNEGLDVKVKPGGPERDAIRELELGHADFGVASADQVIRAVAKGAPVVVLAQFFQINPLQWIYRASKPPIKSLDDLKGRIIGITYGGNDETIMRTLLAKAKIKESEVKFFSVRYDYTPFFKGKTDIWPVYKNSQGPILTKKLEKAGEKAAFFDPAEFGVKFVANSLVTSKKMLTNNPDIVKKFTKALLNAWTKSLDPKNEENALKTLSMFDKDTPPEILKEQLKITRRLVKPKPDTIIGTIDVKAWQQTEKIMLEQKLISEPVHVEKVLMPLN